MAVSPNLKGMTSLSLTVAIVIEHAKSHWLMFEQDPKRYSLGVMSCNYLGHVT